MYWFTQRLRESPLHRGFPDRRLLFPRSRDSVLCAGSVTPVVWIPSQSERHPLQRPQQVVATVGLRHPLQKAPHSSTRITPTTSSTIVPVSSNAGKTIESPFRDRSPRRGQSQSKPPRPARGTTDHAHAQDRRASSTIDDSRSSTNRRRRRSQSTPVPGGPPGVTHEQSGRSPTTRVIV